jgi:hypothetical protein
MKLSRVCTIPFRFIVGFLEMTVFMFQYLGVFFGTCIFIHIALVLAGLSEPMGFETPVLRHSWNFVAAFLNFTVDIVALYVWYTNAAVNRLFFPYLQDVFSFDLPRLPKALEYVHDDWNYRKLGEVECASGYSGPACDVVTAQ